MAITFHPKPGTVLMCDFAGFKEPEMIKVRPVVIVSPAHLMRPQLYTIVPLSTTAPVPPEAYHYKFETCPIPGMKGETWAKCDMVASVSIARLDRVRVSRGIYKVGMIAADELAAIRQCMKPALGIP